MAYTRQIFQTNSKWRWRTIQWTGWIVFLAIILMVPVVIVTLAKGIMPGLPLLTNEEYALHHLSHPVVPAGLSQKELKKYKGFSDFLKMRQQNEKLANKKPELTNQQIRAAFYVDWDPQSFYSLQKNVDKLNTIVPEWFFIDPSADTLRPE